MEITNVNRKNRHACSSTKRIIISRHLLCRWKAYDEMSGVASCSFPMHNEKRIKIGPRRMQCPQDSWCADQRQAPKTYIGSQCTHDTQSCLLPIYMSHQPLSPDLMKSLFKSSTTKKKFLKMCMRVVELSTTSKKIKIKEITNWETVFTVYLPKR